MEELKTSDSIQGQHLPNFETLDGKIANVLKTIFTASDFKKKVFTEEQRAHNEH